MSKLTQIKEAISALETTAEGQLRGGFIVIGGGEDVSPLSNGNCGCNTNVVCDCGCGSNDNCGCTANLSCPIKTPPSKGNSAIPGLLSF